MEVEVADDLVSHMASNVDGNDARLPMKELIDYELSIIIFDVVMWVTVALPRCLQHPRAWKLKTGKVMFEDGLPTFHG